MSHEIRTPLNAVTGISYLLKQTSLNDKQSEYLDTVDRSMDHVLGIINDLLDFSKLAAGKLELEAKPFNLSQVLESITDFVPPGSEEDVKVLINISPEVPRSLIGDPMRLSQILINLVSNGVKFSEQDVVTVLVTVDQRRDEYVSLRFVVKDTGIGMDDAQVSQLFEAFQQADDSITRRFGGTGLGLAICKSLVLAMDGNISVLSKPGQGSEFNFSVWLGLQQVEIQKINESPSRTDQMKGNGRCVLLVEDQMINREIATEILVCNGYTVESSENGQLAVERIEQNPSKFDIVLMDLQMPVMDGYEATRRIRHQFNAEQLPIIAMTAHAFDDEQKKCLEIGMNAHVSKPIDVDLLLSKLDEQLR